MSAEKEKTIPRGWFFFFSRAACGLDEPKGFDNQAKHICKLACKCASADCSARPLRMQSGAIARLDLFKASRKEYDCPKGQTMSLLCKRYELHFVQRYEFRFAQRDDFATRKL